MLQWDLILCKLWARETSKDSEKPPNPLCFSNTGSCSRSTKSADSSPSFSKLFEINGILLNAPGFWWRPIKTCQDLSRSDCCLTNHGFNRLHLQVLSKFLNYISLESAVASFHKLWFDISKSLQCSVKLIQTASYSLRLHSVALSHWWVLPVESSK